MNEMAVGTKEYVSKKKKNSIINKTQVTLATGTGQLERNTQLWPVFPYRHIDSVLVSLLNGF